MLICPRCGSFWQCNHKNGKYFIKYLHYNSIYEPAASIAARIAALGAAYPEAESRDSVPTTLPEHRTLAHAAMSSKDNLFFT